MSARRQFRPFWLGRCAYDPVHALQLELVEARKAGRIGDTLLFVEHEPVVTLGRGASEAHVLVSHGRLAELGVGLVATGRGGDVTLHAPGQLVCYPILDLSPDRQDVRRYVRDLTSVMQRLALDYGVESGRSDKYIGLWADREAPRSPFEFERARWPVKIGAIGVRISRWVTMHGFALNLSTPLELFGLIQPCGISEFGVSSISALTGAVHEVREAAERALPAFAAVFDAELLPLRSEWPR